MGFIEYANNVLPILVPQYMKAFGGIDPTWRDITQPNRKQLSGGERVRIRRIKGGQSEPQVMDGTRHTLSFSPEGVFDKVEFDWVRFLLPVIFDHRDQNRYSPAEAKRVVQEVVSATMGRHMHRMMRWFYSGEAVGGITPNLYPYLGTLWGPSTVGKTTGLTNGAISFRTPANQVAAGLTYGGLARSYDSTDYMDLWYNEFKAHPGIGAGFLSVVEEIKKLADLNSDMPTSGIKYGLMSVAHHTLLGDEIRSYPGTVGSALTYTVDDLEKGKAHKVVHVAGGVHYHATRFFPPSAQAAQEPVLLINPDGIEYWVNRSLDHKARPAVDGLNGYGVDADVIVVETEMQMLCTKPYLQGATAKVEIV